MPRPRKDRSEYEDGRQHGSVTDELHAAYRGDSFNGIGEPDDDNPHQEGD